MFIRRAKTRTTENGETYYAYRLVHSERLDDKVRQRTLLNLGSNFPVERQHWPLLCARIEQLRGRQGDLVQLNCPRDVEWHAQHIAAQLLERAPVPAAEPPDLQTVDVNSLALIRPRSVGVEALGLWAMEQLGLGGALERLGFGAKERALAMATVIARMARPGSERATWRWLCERSALGELLDVDFEQHERHAPLPGLRRPVGQPGRHRSPSLRTGDGPLRPLTYGDPVRPDQHLL